MLGKSGKKFKLKRIMKNAENYDEWLSAALEYDFLSKKSEDHLKFKASLPENNLKKIIIKLRTLQTPETAEQLISQLKDQIYAYYYELTDPSFYSENKSGYPPTVISDFVKTIEESLIFLCNTEIPGYSDKIKLHLFKDYYKTLGRTALMLSGGGALGIYHLGVVKALFYEDLLPDIISGSSMGAIVGAGICSRNKEELNDFLQHPEQISKKAFKLKNPFGIASEKALFDTTTLLRHIQSNMNGDLTFAEAYEKTGLSLNISVAPTKVKQKPRVLNHITAPNVLISYAATASCAMPGLYKPAVLMAKTSSGEKVPHMPSERWIDGTLGDDLPMHRISRLLNVNHFIVSQANPHVVPFIGMHPNKDFKSVGAELAASMLRHQAQSVVTTFKKRVEQYKTGLILNQINTLLSQNYIGDINIYPPFSPKLYSKMLSNPTDEDLKMYVKLGERVTWPKIKLIADQTMLKRIFENCIKKLERKISDENG